MSLCELTRVAIQELIPHRDPFLFLESAQLESEKDVIGLAVWTKTHPILQGHFPQKPIVPAICLIEAGAQLAGVLLRWQSQYLQMPHQGLGMLVGVQKSKFRRTLVPDELLALHCRIRALNSHAFVVQCKGSTQTDSKVVFESEILLAQRVSAP
jgi:3-hydroxyacyl-[acyl-carrier-protein] dehydratase